MKSFRHSASSPHNGIKLAAVVSSAIMMAPVALGTASIFADTNTLGTSATTTSLSAAYTDPRLINLNTQLAAYKTFTSSTAFSMLDPNTQGKYTALASVAQSLLDTAAAQLITNGKLDLSTLTNVATTQSSLITTSADLTKLLSTPDSSSTLTALTQRQNTFRTAYSNLSSAQQASAAGIQLKAAIDSTTTALNSYSVSPNTAGRLVDSMTAALAPFAGSINTPGDAQQSAIDASNAAKNRYSTVPVFLQGSKEYQKLGDVIDDTAAQVNDKNLSNADAISVAKNLNAATSAMNALVKASVVYSGNGTIRYPKGYGIQVWTIGGKMVKNSNGTAKKLKGGTKWKVFGPVLNINGSKMYNLGGNQFIDAGYVKFAAKK